MNITTNSDYKSFHPQIPDHRDVIKGELAQSGEWVVADVETDGCWPVTSQKVRWGGIDIWIMPIMRGFYPALAIKVPPGRSRLECEKLLMRFLSVLSWVEEQGFMVEGGACGGGNLPRPMVRDKQSGFSICDEFDLSYFPEVTKEKALLALALMREGRGLNHVGYAFLSFYRVLEAAFPNTRQRVTWISAALTNLVGFGINEALEGIKAQGVTDIGRHLYESGRCAMAHANRKPIVDPDDPTEARRLAAELPIMRALAVKAIEDVFKVETRDTNFRKHVYELDGFKRIFGPAIVSHLQKGTAPPEQTVNVPDINVRIRRKEAYAPLEGLRCKRVGYGDKLIQMQFQSLQGDVSIKFSLDFGAERLQFDIFTDVAIYDTGGVESAERVHEVSRFWQDYFANGQLQILDSETGDLISRKDAFIPVNMYFDHDGAAAVLARWKTLADQRRNRDRKFGEEMQRNAVGYNVQIVHVPPAR